VPHEAVPLEQVDLGLGAVVVDQAELHSLGDLTEHGEIGTCPAVICSQRIGGTRSDLQVFLLASD
jgi:hypothetical protein